MRPPRPPSHQRALRILMTLGGLAVVLGVGGLLAADRYMRGKYEPVIAQIRQDVTPPESRAVGPYAEGEYREAYTAFEADLEVLSCSTALARQIWERGLTAEQFQQREGEAPPLRGVRGQLPKVLFGSRIANTLLAVSTSSLKRLKEFRAALEAQPPSRE